MLAGGTLNSESGTLSNESGMVTVVTEDVVEGGVVELGTRKVKQQRQECLLGLLEQALAPSYCHRCVIHPLTLWV